MEERTQDERPAGSKRADEENAGRKDARMTFIDPSAGRHHVSLQDLESWGLAWDSYDPAAHGDIPMPAFYPAARIENWWGSTLSLDDLLDLAQVHGIPVAWVPDRALLRALAAAGDHEPFQCGHCRVTSVPRVGVRNGQGPRAVE
jgi:hypothetical protein